MTIRDYYGVFSDIWHLFKRYFQTEEWDSLALDAKNIMAKYAGNLRVEALILGVVKALEVK